MFVKARVFEPGRGFQASLMIKAPERCFVWVESSLTPEH